MRANRSLVLSGPIALEGWDQEETAEFQRPSRLEAEAIAKMRASTPLQWEEDGKVLTQPIQTPLAVIESEMVALTLVNCSVMNEKGDGGKEPLFVPGRNCRQPGKPLDDLVRQRFYRTWGNMEDELCEAVVAALRKFHAPFDWRNPQRGEAND